MTQRFQFLIRGQVQGVGFRPHVFRIASDLNLTGWVQNTPQGVLLEVQGQQASAFWPKLTADLPPLASIVDIRQEEQAFIQGEKTFEIISSRSGTAQTLIAPDTCICQACLKELFDPQSRYYHYPFINCTQCGPRLTITATLPYDRCNTSMQDFKFCPPCKQDYSQPQNRRYHAQPIACSNCGPKLSMDIEEIAHALSQGDIIALKGMGGYQLLCDATNAATVTKLRQKKNRPSKPLALMVLNVQTAATLVHIDDEAEKLLMSPARPIVLLKKKKALLPENIAPGLSHLGIMLAATPIHYLIFNALAHFPEDARWLDTIHPSILVATSGNFSANPLVIEDKKALEELGEIADKVVSYNRRILTGLDDSVVRIMNSKPVFIRRARGYVPQRIPLAQPLAPTLALGGHLKNTFCLIRENEAFISQHIGSLNNRDAIHFFQETLDHWMTLLGIKPERIACDLHPDFYTSQLAENWGLTVTRVQHHHAHLAAVAAEHHLLEPALGLALDGYGYGFDGQAWGGELFFLEKEKVKRLSHFMPLVQPGGERAAKEPWRMAAAVLHQLDLGKTIKQRFSKEPQASDLAHLLESGMPMGLTSSCGRLFDAASALLGINHHSFYEGQAAIMLESLVTKPAVLDSGWDLKQGVFNMLPTFERLLYCSPEEGANLFHGTLIAGLTEWILFWSQKIACSIILLSGGCFLNKVLTQGLTRQLQQKGLRVYLPQQLPPNDGGLSLGQAWIAGIANQNRRID